MVGYVQSLDRLGFPISEEFTTDIVLNSLPSAYGPWISNYHIVTAQFWYPKVSAKFSLLLGIAS